MHTRMLVIPLFLAFLMANTISYTSASSKSPYESGYDHGCDDADISDPDDRYINQPEKGPSFHTNEFMRGYNDGYDECSSDNGNSDSSDRTGRCFGEGHVDGRDNPFSKDMYDECGGNSAGPGNN